MPGPGPHLQAIQGADPVYLENILGSMTGSASDASPERLNNVFGNTSAANPEFVFNTFFFVTEWKDSEYAGFPFFSNLHR